MKMKKSELLEEYFEVCRMCEYEMEDYWEDLVELSDKYGVDYTYNDNLRKKDNVCELGGLILMEITDLIIGDDEEVEINGRDIGGNHFIM